MLNKIEKHELFQVLEDLMALDILDVGLENIENEEIPLSTRRNWALLWRAKDKLAHVIDGRYEHRKAREYIENQSNVNLVKDRITIYRKLYNVIKQGDSKRK